MDATYIQLLGRVAFVRDGRAEVLPRAQTRGVLALLALNAGRVMSLDQVAAAMWGDEEPATARAQIHTAVSSIRRLLASDRATGADPANDVAARCAPTVVGGRFGYELTIDPAEVDALRFEQMVRRGALDAADPPATGARLRQALVLWRGEPLADAAGAFVDGVRQQLSDRRLTALDDLAALDLAAGRAAEVAAELAPVIAEHPGHERLRGRLMVALFRSGRQAEALRLFHDYRRWLADREGLDPGAEIVATADAILRDRLPPPAKPDDAREPVGPQAAPADPPGASPPSRSPADAAVEPHPRNRVLVRPAGLPPAPTGFVGRVGELRWLTEAAQAGGVYAVVGTGGVGKTALALHWGHRQRSRFADGQLYIEMHGYSPGRPVTALDALGRFLRAFNVGAEKIPSDVDEAATLYRSVLADRQVLVVLDNVRSAECVRPLLPSGPGCATLVTSRDSLDALVAVDGARRLDLDVLPLGDAIALLAGLLGEARVRAEPTAAAELASACACLPLALRITAAQLTARPRRRLAQHGRDLREDDRLSVLSLGDDPAASVAATLNTSYHTLPAHVARLYRLLGLSPAADLDRWGLAALTGLPVPEVGELAGQLVAAHVVTEISPDRYALHDLVHAHAAMLASTTDTAVQRCDAVTQLIEWYADTAMIANRTLVPAWQPPEWSRALPPVNPRTFDSESQAMAWLDREHSTLVALIHRAAEAGVEQAVLPLVQGQFTYLLRHQRAETMIELNRLNWEIATRRDDDLGAAASAQSLGIGYSLLNRLDEAVSWYTRTLELNERLGLENRVARTHMNLGAIYSDSGQLEQAVHHLQWGLAISRRIDDGLGESHALGNLAYAYQQMRAWDLAEPTFIEAVAVARRVSNRHGECLAESNLGAMHLEQARYNEAAAHLDAGLRLAEELEDQLTIARNHLLLGDVQLTRGDRRRAYAEWQEALGIFLDLDHPEAAGAQDRLRAQASLSHSRQSTVDHDN
jgi:DNA-binding SARP family transcriptional activator